MTKIIEGWWNKVSKNLETLTAAESESQKALRKVRNALKLPQLSAKPMLNQASQRDLGNLISAAGADVAEKARRERLLRDLICGQSAPLELVKDSLERAGASSSKWKSNLLTLASASENM